MSETWRPLYKFDCTPRQLAEFQPRCAEYQTARESVLLAATPVLIIRVSRYQIELEIKVHEDFSVIMKSSRTFASGSKSITSCTNLKHFP